MKLIYAIDPGTEDSGVLVYDPNDRTIIDCGQRTNRDLLGDLMSGCSDGSILVIEGIESFGLAVGKEVFATCEWRGRFIQAHYTAAHEEAVTIYRSQVKLHLCHSSKAKSTNIRQALIDRFGPGKAKAIGRKKSPGPLYKVKEHSWSALAVAITYVEQFEAKNET